MVLGEDRNSDQRIDGSEVASGVEVVLLNLNSGAQVATPAAGRAWTWIWTAVCRGRCSASVAVEPASTPKPRSCRPTATSTASSTSIATTTSSKIPARKPRTPWWRRTVACPTGTSRRRRTPTAGSRSRTSLVAPLPAGRRVDRPPGGSAPVRSRGTGKAGRGHRACGAPVRRSSQGHDGARQDGLRGRRGSQDRHQPDEQGRLCAQGHHRHVRSGRRRPLRPGADGGQLG
ncbi:hypothetical protein LX90_001443 [Lentzea flava]|nr:hypothetical protein [Lentzea flava]